MINRNNAIFKEQTRILRQAEELSIKLLDRLENNENPLFLGIKQCGFENNITISKIEQLKEIEAITKKQINNISGQIDSSYAIPVFLETATLFYDRNKKNIFNFGVALKESCVYLWKNLYDNKNSNIKALSKLEELVLLVLFKNQLDTLINYYEILEFKPFEILGNEIKGDTDFNLLKIELLFYGRGNEHRTILNSLNAIWKDQLQLVKFNDALERFLIGKMSNTEEIFKNTIFSDIQTNNIEFWLGLWARFKILQIASVARLAVINEKEQAKGIAVFAEVNFSQHYKIPIKQIQEALYKVFWKEEWYKKAILNNSNLGNLLLERPVLRFINNPTYFVTTIPILMDAINWYVEAAIFKYDKGIKNIPKVASNVFEKYISIPFENNTIELLRNNNYLAGEVTANGIWKTQNGNIQLKNINNTNVGQIDALAYNKTQKKLIILDCKILHQPNDKKILKNVLLKTTLGDAEGFHSKLKTKFDWVLQTDYFKTNRIIKTIKFVLLDRYMPFSAKSDYLVLSFKELKILLEKNIYSDNIKKIKLEIFKEMINEFC